MKTELKLFSVLKSFFTNCLSFLTAPYPDSEIEVALLPVTFVNDMLLNKIGLL